MDDPKTLQTLCSLDQHLEQVERRIALLERVIPLNAQEQSLRLERALMRGEFEWCELRYRPLAAPDARLATELSACSMGLHSLASHQAVGGSPLWGPLVEMCLSRVEELQLELRIAQQCSSSQGQARSPCSDGHGLPSPRVLARKRYLPQGDAVTRSIANARAWLERSQSELASQSGLGQQNELRQQSELAPRSGQGASDAPQEDEPRVGLASYFTRRAREQGWGLRVIERPLTSLAAATVDGLVAQSGAWVTLREAERLWVHEVQAHWLPRQGQKHLPLLRVGAAHADRDEEGRALLLEARHGLRSAQRERELAVRHLISCAVLAGPDAGGESQVLCESVETVALELVRKGVPAELIARASVRALRGGGLAREVIYLDGLHRVSSALEAAPELEHWMQRGRVSIELARHYQAHVEQLDSLAAY